MSYYTPSQVFPDHMPLPNWSSNAFIETGGETDGNNTTTQRPDAALALHTIEEIDVDDLQLPELHENSNIYMTGVGPSTRCVREGANIFVAPPAPHPPQASVATAGIETNVANHLALYSFASLREAENSDEVEKGHSGFNRTVSGWELEELVDLNYNTESSDFEDSLASAPDDSNDFINTDIATLAPYAPENLGLYSEIVGEILTHESWKRIIAGIPPGMPLSDEEQRGAAHKPMIEPAVSSEDGNVATPRRAQFKAEDDIYDATAPCIVVEDPYDSDNSYGRSEAELGGSRSIHDTDNADEEDDDPFTDIPLPKEDSDDDDFVMPANKRGPRRKAPGTVSAGSRKQGKKSQGRAHGGAGPTRTPARPKTLITGPSAPHITNHPSGQDKSKESRLLFAKATQQSGNSQRKLNQRAIHRMASSHSPGPAASGPSHGSSAEEVIPEDVGAHALRLQKQVTTLRAEVTLAEARYEEAANNPRVSKDPRTKKRREAKLKETREKFRQAVDEQAQFEERCGSPKSQTRGTANEGPTALSATLASSSHVAPAMSTSTFLQTLEQEIRHWHGTVQTLRRKVAHCQAQVDAVEANPQQFADKRTGFKKGRETRLENAQHQLSHNLQMLDDKQRLYNEEYQRAHGVAMAEGHTGQPTQQQEPDTPESKQRARVVADEKSQLLVLQTSNPRKRKSFEVDDDGDEDEEGKKEKKVTPARSKATVVLGTPG